MPWSERCDRRYAAQFGNRCWNSAKPPGSICSPLASCRIISTSYWDQPNSTSSPSAIRGKLGPPGSRGGQVMLANSGSPACTTWLSETSHNSKAPLATSSTIPCAPACASRRRTGPTPGHFGGINGSCAPPWARRPGRATTQHRFQPNRLPSSKRSARGCAPTPAPSANHPPPPSRPLHPPLLQ